MRHSIIILPSVLLISLSMCLSAQERNITVPLSDSAEPVAEGRFEPTWESLSTYQVPEWFRDAKFGIWAHWGAQCVEGSGDWNARRIYQEEESYYYKWHRKHYGHPSEFGFKDVLPLFKAENWDPEELLRFYKDVVGAQYFFALGNHHDNFDLWDSQYQEWNSVDIGPHKDILEGWSKAAEKVGLPFGISFHADNPWSWYEPSRGSDSKGKMKGVRYDGWLTKEDGYKPNPDGTEKWWKGLDPQELYSQSPKFKGDSTPTEAFVTKFYNRTLDAINRYHPDLIYFDNIVLPFYFYSDAGLKIAAHLYNSTDGQGVLFGKVLNEDQRKALTWDVEKGAPNEIMPQPWQCCNCIGGWHYNERIYRKGSYKSAAVVAKLLVDIVSKNGNLLLSVPLRGDGTPDEKELAILLEFGAWMKINSESIVKTRPWKRFGEGPVADADIKVNGHGFNEEKYTDAGTDEIRFTQNDEYLYVSALGWPKSRKMVIKSLSSNSSLFPSGINQVELLGYGDLKFTRTEEALTVFLPETDLNRIMPVLRIRL